MSSTMRAEAGGGAFSDSSFDVEGYLSNRPRYPPHLYDTIREYTFKTEPISSNKTLLDLGCGPGFAAFPLLFGERNTSFQNLIGIDPGASMIKSASRAYDAYVSSQSASIQAEKRNVSFQVGSSDNLSSILSDGVDTVIAATAAHWFEYESTWTELSRVVNPKGSVIFWTYGSNFLPDHPDLYPMILDFMQDGNPHDGTSIGPYFEQPGRNRLNNLLKSIPFPTNTDLNIEKEYKSQWDTNTILRKTHDTHSSHCSKDGIPLIELGFYRSTDFSTRNINEGPLRLEQVMNWSQFKAYIRTSSALHYYHQKFPQDKQNPDGDIVDRFVARLKNCVVQDRAKGVGTLEGLDEQHIRVAWPLGLMAIKKKV
ncbi:unnamed protein product [Sympodiomycopsis kandeliae]